MTEDLIVATTRLELVSAGEVILRAELEGSAKLASALGAVVPSSWPPEHYDRGAVEWALRERDRHPEAEGWGTWYVVLSAEQGAGRTVIGIAGYKGQPDAEGTVEVGYSILPEYQRQGYATEAVGGLVARAFALPQVRRLIAETYPELTPSIGVLEKLGFAPAEEAGSEPGVVRYELPRSRYAGPTAAPAS